MSMGSISRSEALESDYTTLSAPTEILILELQSNVTEEGLRRIFDGYGPISRCSIGIDTQRNVRFASIVYERSADAVQACQMSGKYIDDKRIVVQLRSNSSSSISSAGSNSNSNNSANNNNKYANNPNPNPTSNPNNSSPIYKSSGSHPSPVSHPSTTSPHVPLSSSSSSSSTMPTSTTLAQSQQQQPPFGKITSVNNAATSASSLSSSTGINTNSNVLHSPPIVQSPSPAYYMQSFVPFTHHPQPQVAPSGGKSSPTNGSSISTSTNGTRMPSSSFSSNSTPTATSPTSSSTSPSVSPALFEAMGNLSLHSGGGGGSASGNASRGTSPDQSTSPDESTAMTSSGGRTNTGNPVYASQLQQQLQQQQQQQQQQQLQQQQQQQAQQLPLSGDHMKDFGNHPPRGLSPAHMTAAVAHQQQPPLLSFNPVTGLVQQTHAPQHSPVLPMYRFTTTPGSSTPPTEAYSHMHMQTPNQMHHAGKHRSISHSSAPGGYYPVMAPYDLVDYSNLTTATGGVHMSAGSAASSSYPTPGSSVAATPVPSLPATPAKQGGGARSNQQQQQQQQTPTSGSRQAAKSLHLMVPATPPVQLIALDHEQQQRLSDPNPLGSTDGMGGGMSMTMSATFGSSSMPALAHASFTSSNNATALSSSSTTPTPASGAAAMLQQHQQQQQQLSANQQQQQQQQVQALQAAAAAAAAGGQPMVHYTQQALPNIAPNYVMDMHGNVSYVPSYQLRSLPGSSTYFVEPAPIVSPRGGVCLFVFHLPAQMTEHELTVLFQHCGTVLSVKIITDPETRQSKGYGFVNMASQQEAEQAINMLNGTRYRNKYLKVSFKQKKGMAMMGLAMGGAGTSVMMMPNGGMISTPQSGGGGSMTMSSPPGSARMTSSGGGNMGSIVSPASSVSSLSSPGTYQMSSSPHLLQFTSNHNNNQIAVSPSSSSSMMSPLPSSTSSTPSHARFAQRGSDVSTSSLASTPSHAGSTMSGSTSARSSASSVPTTDTKNGPQGLLISSDSRSSVSSNVSVGGSGGSGSGDLTYSAGSETSN